MHSNFSKLIIIKTGSWMTKRLLLLLSNQKAATQLVSSQFFPYSAAAAAAATYNISVRGSLSRPCHHSSGKRQVDPAAVRKANY
jgi:hypothetical protein